MIPILLTSLLSFFIGCNTEKIDSEPEKSKGQRVEDNTADFVRQADEALRSENLPEMDASYAKAIKSDPSNVDAASGAAYAALLQEDYVTADAYLKNVQQSAGERKGEVLLRRSIIAMRKLDFEQARQHAIDSGLQMGLLFAAEIDIMNDEFSSAIELLKKITDGQIFGLAEKYLQYIEKDDDYLRLIAVTNVMWAMRDRKIAVRTANDVFLQSDFARAPLKAEEFNNLYILWSARAVSIGETEIAQNLLQKSKSKKDWQHLATEAIVSCAIGQSKTIKRCKSIFRKLEGIAPSQGLKDAKATAAQLTYAKAPDVAKELLSDVSGNSAARVLALIGDNNAAEDAADGIFLKYLEGR